MQEIHLHLDRKVCFIRKQHLSGNVFYGLSMKKRQADQQVLDRKNAWCHAQLGLKELLFYYGDIAVSIASSEFACSSRVCEGFLLVLWFSLCTQADSLRGEGTTTWTISSLP